MRSSDVEGEALSLRNETKGLLSQTKKGKQKHLREDEQDKVVAVELEHVEIHGEEAVAEDHQGPLDPHHQLKEHQIIGEAIYGNKYGDF